MDLGLPKPICPPFLVCVFSDESPIIDNFVFTHNNLGRDDVILPRLAVIASCMLPPAGLWPPRSIRDR